MRIYNPFRNETYAKTFSTFWIEKFYERMNTFTDDYEIYMSEELLEVVYVLKDEKIGKRLFPVIQCLKDMGSINLEYYNMNVRKTVIDRKEKRLLAFYMNFSKKENATSTKNFDRLKNLIDLTVFINEMDKLGFGILGDFFNEELCYSFFQYISGFYKYNEDEKEEGRNKTYDILLRSIHYRIQKERLDHFYCKLQEKEFVKMSQVNYSFGMFHMFYTYYKTRKMPEDILTVLKEEESKECLAEGSDCYTSEERPCKRVGHDIKACCQLYDVKLIHSLNLLEQNCKKVEETDIYTIFEKGEMSKYKIYQKTDEALYANIKELYGIKKLDSLVNFYVVSILFDINANFIGYEYHENSDINLLSLNQLVFDDIKSLVYDLWNIRALFTILEFEESSGCDDSLVIEDDISFCSVASSTTFYFTNTDSLIRALHCDDSIVNEQLGNLALKYYSNYIKSLYKITDEKITKDLLYSLFEFRILPPKFAIELCNYMLNIKVDAITAYFSFFVDFAKNYSEGNGEYVYYSKFIYDPAKTEYLFVDQVHEMFNIEAKYDTETQLEDGRIVHFFKGKKGLEKLSKGIMENEEILRRIFPYYHYDDINKIGINKLIYLRSISNDGSYYLIGYVSDPVKGKLLSELDFSKLSNKDFIRMAMSLFVCFNKSYISFSNIRMDDDFNFYINMFEKIVVVKTGKKRSFAERLLDRFKIKGLDKQFIASIDFNDANSLRCLYFSLNSYCDIHGVYFSSAEGICPICKRTICNVEKYNGDFGRSVFEDEYAIHYILDGTKNIKVYKEDVIDMKKMEQNIDNFLEECPNLGQDMFIPYKKAIIASSRKFIGYVYKRVDFSECINLEKDFYNLKKLKGLLKLCLQVLELERAGYFFYMNPYNSVLISKKNKETVQLVNIDLLNFKGDDKESIQEHSEEFIIEYVSANLSNEVGMEEVNANSLTELITNMKLLASNMTKICIVHGIHYHKKYILCPKCVPNFDPTILEKNAVYLDVEKWKMGKTPKNEGGESFIYRYSNGTYAKIFKEEVSVEMKFAIIMKIFERKAILDKFNNKNSKFVNVTPQKIIIDSGTNSISGYILQEIDGVPISTLRDKLEVERLGLEIKDIMEILINTGEGIEYLHKKANMFIGDLNGRNILFDKDKVVYFIDFDGMGIDDICPEFFTDEYVDPVARKNNTISMKDDWYSFAIQAFYYLTLTHPFNGIYYDEQEKRNLEIDEKMEKRISLLGNHGMKPPSVARSWKWMNGPILKVFLNIFEGDTRVNITPYLKKYYNSTFSSKYVGCSDLNEDTTFSDLKVVTKTVIREILLFGDDCKRIINDIAYISVDENGNDTLNICVNDEVKKFCCKNLNSVIDVILSDNKEFVFIIFKKAIVTMCIATCKQVFESNLNEIPKFAVNGSTLYYSNFANRENVILKLEFGDGELLRKTVIKFQTQMYTNAFLVVNNEKFVIVKQDADKDYIFCNDTNYLTLPKEKGNVQYRVLYDEVKKEWLIINTNGRYIVIKSDGKNICLTDEELVGCNIRRVQFIKGNIYVPKDGGIYIIKTKSPKGKLITCDQTTPNMIQELKRLLIRNPLISIEI